MHISINLKESAPIIIFSLVPGPSLGCNEATMLLAILSAFSLTILANQSLSASSATIPRVIVPQNVLSLSRTIQETDYSCGPASLLSVLRYWNVYPGDEKGLYALLGTTPQNGTHPKHLEEGAQFFGLAAEMKENLTMEDLNAAVEKDVTVIVDLQAWSGARKNNWDYKWDDGHYVVYVGSHHNNAFFMDPSAEGNYAYIPIEEFLRRWHDYESGNGVMWRNRHLGILIHSKNGSHSVPFVPHPTGLNALRMK